MRMGPGIEPHRAFPRLPELARGTLPSDTINMKAIMCLIFVLAGVLCGCFQTQKQWELDLSKDKTDMQSMGWTYIETLGVSGQWVSKVGGDAATARTIGADWVVNGAQQHKVFNQEEYAYAIHTFIKANGDSFSFVFRKANSKAP